MSWSTGDDLPMSTCSICEAEFIHCDCGGIHCPEPSHECHFGGPCRDWSPSATTPDEPAPSLVGSKGQEPT